MKNCYLKIYSTVLFLLIWYNADSQKVAQFSFEETTGIATTSESITSTSFAVSNHFNRPERIVGIKGNALRLDGYSTWASNNSFKFNGITNQMSIEAWYTTEAFNKEKGGIISQISNSGGFALSIGPWGNVYIDFFADGKKYSLQSSNTVEKYKWNHIVASIDLANAKAKIFLNGTESASLSLPACNQINLDNNSTIFLGRRNDEVLFSNFLLTSLNGAIDEIGVYNSILTDKDIASNYSASASSVPDLNIDPEIRHQGDFLRPCYHAMPNTSWTNEPYGLNYYQGKYHLFFQKNPNSPTLYFMHWGHLTSTDLVNWTEEKVALAPSNGFDSFGVWSGTTIKDNNGKPRIIYTGVDGVKAGIGMATADDDQLSVWTKYANNPIIPSVPNNYSAMDFRDPYVWKDGNTYYMIVGSGIQNEGGGILFTYKSTDLEHWQAINPMYRNIFSNTAGVFWEMPTFNKLPNQDYLLTVTPIPYQGKPAETLYWVGKWENEKFTPYDNTPKKIELLNSKMLSPSMGTDENGEICYIGILAEDRSEADQLKAGWRHTFSIPRLIRPMKNNLIGQVPHPNLCRLRENHRLVQNRVIQLNTNFNTPEVEGTQMEMNYVIKAEKSSSFMIQVYKNADLSEFTSILFNLATNKIALDRRSSTQSNATKDYREAQYIFDEKDNINIRIFLDHSTLEVFIDNALVFSARVYPSKIDSKKTDIILTSGVVQLVSLDAWDLKKKTEVMPIETCVIPNLSDSVRELAVVSSLFSTQKNQTTIFPNPVDNILKLTVSYEIPEDISISIIDLYGCVVKQAGYESITGNTTSAQIDVSSLRNGVYLVRMQSKKYSSCSNFIVMH